MPPREDTSTKMTPDALSGLENAVHESTERLRTCLQAGDFDGATQAARARHACLTQVPGDTGENLTPRVRALFESALASDRAIQREAAAQRARLQQQIRQLRYQSRAQALYDEIHTN